MAEINDLNIVAASNTARFPEFQSPSSVNNGARSLESIIARWHKDTSGHLTSTGSSNAYIVAANQTLSSLYQGLEITFEANFSNTTSATLNVDALGAKTIKKHNDQNLASGDIESGQIVTVIYEASADVWQMQSQLGNAPASTTADNSWSADQTIVSTDAGATEGPGLNLHRNSASPADSDVIGAVRFKGEDDGSNETTYAKINAVIDDVTGGTEDGHIEFATTQAGTLADRFHIGGGLYADGNSDPGAGKIDADQYVQNGVALSGLSFVESSVTDLSSGSPSTHDFTGLTGAYRITLHIKGASLSGTDEFELLLGDAGGFETSGYTGEVWDHNVATDGVNSSSWLISRAGVASALWDITVTMTRLDASGFLWGYAGSGHATSSGSVANFNGTKALSAALTQVQLKSTGSNTFDAGAAYLVAEIAN